MTQIFTVDGLNKGDIVTFKELSPFYDCATDSFENVEYNHKFKITRNNKKTYSCEYIEGAFKGIGFKWIKGYDLASLSNKEFYKRYYIDQPQQ